MLYKMEKSSTFVKNHGKILSRTIPFQYDTDNYHDLFRYTKLVLLTYPSHFSDLPVFLPRSCQHQLLIAK